MVAFRHRRDPDATFFKVKTGTEFVNPFAPRALQDALRAKSFWEFADFGVPCVREVRHRGPSMGELLDIRRAARCLAALLVVVLGCLALGMERQGTAVVLHVRVEGHIDSVAMVRELQGHLERGADPRFEGVLLELGPGRIRDDLAWTLGSAISAARSPVWVWLAGDGGDAGPEQLELAMLGTASWIDPGVSVVWEGPPACGELMPETVDRDRMVRERYSSLWVALERRGANTRLAEGLLRPSAPLRATRVVAGECELVQGPVAPGEDRGLLTLVEPVANGGTRGHVPPSVAVALHMVDGVERSARLVLRRALGEDAARGLRTERVSLKSDLAAQIEEAHKQIAIARAEAALARDQLRERIESGLGRGAYDRAVRARAREALATVERGEAALQQFESLADEHPEVLRTRAPVQADLPGVEETAARAWAREIEYIRRGLASTRAEAMAESQG